MDLPTCSEVVYTLKILHPTLLKMSLLLAAGATNLQVSKGEGVAFDAERWQQTKYAENTTPILLHACFSSIYFSLTKYFFVVFYSYFVFPLSLSEFKCFFISCDISRLIYFSCCFLHIWCCFLQNLIQLNSFVNLFLGAPV